MEAGSTDSTSCLRENLVRVVQAVDQVSDRVSAGSICGLKPTLQDIKMRNQCLGSHGSVVNERAEKMHRISPLDRRHGRKASNNEFLCMIGQ